MKGGEDSLRRVQCLRGRLLAERALSRTAKEDADQMEKKLEELEKQLGIEMKSRNRAEKRLKLLQKKLESLKVQNSPDDSSEHSSMTEKREASSSVSSTASWRVKTHISSPKKFQIEESAADLQVGDNALHTSASNRSHWSSVEESRGSSDRATSEEPNELQSSLKFRDLKADDQIQKDSSLRYAVKKKEEDPDDCVEVGVDNSIALVLLPLDSVKEPQPCEPSMTRPTVEQVLRLLRLAREKLQLSVQRRLLIKVGSN
ncbi:hypothetical protein NMG60_11005453 [Bertholletia excelsa]